MTPTTRVSSTRVTEASANIRWAWLAMDAVTTRAGHQPRCPHSTAQAAASAARKKMAPNDGFQLGGTAMAGSQSTMPMVSALAARPASSPPAAQAASMATEQAAMQQMVAPHRIPCVGLMCTGMASSQYSSGPGSNTPWASRVAWPTSGPCAVSEFHERSAMAALSPSGNHPSRTSRTVPVTKGSQAARCAITRSRVARRSFSGAFSVVGPASAESGTRSGRLILVDACRRFHRKGGRTRPSWPGAAAGFTGLIPVAR